MEFRQLSRKNFLILQKTFHSLDVSALILCKNLTDGKVSVGMLDCKTEKVVLL